MGTFEGKSAEARPPNCMTDIHINVLGYINGPFSPFQIVLGMVFLVPSHVFFFFFFM